MPTHGVHSLTWETAWFSADLWLHSLQTLQQPEPGSNISSVAQFSVHRGWTTTRCSKSLCTGSSNQSHSDPSCRVHAMLCCGVPALQSHSIAGFCLFSTSLNLSYSWDLMNRSVSETMACYSFLLGFKIKQEENQGSLKWKVCLQIALLWTYP